MTLIENDKVKEMHKINIYTWANKLRHELIKNIQTHHLIFSRVIRNTLIHHKYTNTPICYCESAMEISKHKTKVFPGWNTWAENNKITIYRVNIK